MAFCRDDVLLIRADAFTEIGIGHIMRTLALGQAWKDKGGRVVYATCCKSDDLKRKLVDEKFKVINIENPHPDQSDLNQTLNIISELKQEHLDKNSKLAPSQIQKKMWVVVDGYHFEPFYLKAIREMDANVLIIDDTAHLDEYFADVLLNQNMHSEKLVYNCATDPIRLHGSKYVLLRKEFLEWCDWQRTIPNKGKRILVTLGGSDPENVTFRIMNVMNRFEDSELQVKVIVGPANPHLEKLTHLSTLSYLNIQIITNTGNMAHLMKWADIAISAGGSTCWEIAYMGLPAIVVMLAENQKEITKSLELNGVCFNLGWYEYFSDDFLFKALKELIQDKVKRENISHKGRLLVDGLGASRVASVLAEVI